MTELVEAGQIRPVVDRSYPLEEMAEAHRYVAAGHKSGGVAMTVERIFFKKGGGGGGGGGGGKKKKGRGRSGAGS